LTTVIILDMGETVSLAVILSEAKNLAVPLL